MLRIVATLLAVVPLAAGALDWSARVGVDYTRDDRWLPSAERVTYPRLDLNLAFDLNGFVVRPDVVSYLASVEYHRLAREYPGENSVQDRLLYRGFLNLLRGPGHPLQLDLNASRSDESFTLVGATSGSSLTTQWGASVRYTEPERPELRLGYTRTTSERTGMLVADSNRTLQTVNGGILEGTGIFSYYARYQGNYSDGTYLTDQYADHRVDLEARTSIGDDWKVAVNDSYFRRDPSSSATVNPRQEYNSLSATVINGISRTENQRFSYRYSHGIQETPALPSMERTNQRLEYQTRRDLRIPDWRIVATADVSHAQDTLGTATETATGETVGAVVYWRLKKEGAEVFELRGGPSVGYVQPLQRDPFFGFGAVAGAFYQTSFAPATVQLSYGVDFRNDLRVEGQTLSQSVTALASRPLRSGLLTASLLASATRSENPLFGDHLARSITADAGYRWARFDVRFQAGLTDSVNPALDEPISGDGLIVAPYDTHARYVLFNGGAGITPTVRVSGQFRITSSDIPDRPSTMETEARGAVEFNYGALRLALEDRFTMTSVSGTDVRINQFMVRLYRAFGSRY